MKEGVWDIKKIGKDSCSLERYTGDASDVIIPDKIGIYTPIEISATFLKKTNKVRSLKLPKTIEYIDPDAYRTWRNIERIEAEGKKIKAIDGVLYDGSVKTLLFYPPKKSDKYFEAPKTLKRIGDGAFSSTVSFKTFSFHSAFEGWKGHFSECPMLEAFIAEDGDGSLRVESGVLFKNAELVFYPPKRTAGDYRIPDGVESVLSAFPESVHTLFVPASLKAGLEENARNVGAISVDAANSIYTSSDGVLFTRRDKKLVLFPKGKQDTVYMVPRGTFSIASHAFSLSRIKVVVLPSTLVHIEGEAFADSEIECLVIPSSVSDVDIRGLYGMEKLESVYVEAGSIADVYLAGSPKRRYIETI